MDIVPAQFIKAASFTNVVRKKSKNPFAQSDVATNKKNSRFPSLKPNPFRLLTETLLLDNNQDEGDASRLPRAKSSPMVIVTESKEDQTSDEDDAEVVKQRFVSLLKHKKDIFKHNSFRNNSMFLEDSGNGGLSDPSGQNQCVISEIKTTKPRHQFTVLNTSVVCDWAIKTSMIVLSSVESFGWCNFKSSLEESECLVHHMMKCVAESGHLVDPVETEAASIKFRKNCVYWIYPSRDVPPSSQHLLASKLLGKLYSAKLRVVF